MFDIIKNAPDTDSRGRRPNYPLAALNLRDAFDVPCAPIERATLRAKLNAAATYYRRKHPDVRFSVKNSDAGLRVRREA